MLTSSDARKRSLRCVSSPKKPFITLNGQVVLDFCNNDYLGLSQNETLKQASQQATDTYGVSTTSSRLIGGSYDLHHTLEETVANFAQTEAALVFNSGYQASIGLISALAGRHDVILSDRLNHASLVDGAILSRAKHLRYQHLDMDDLENKLKKTPNDQKKWIITDSVFSMDGTCAPIDRLAELADQYQAHLIIDEAHAVGVFGNKHRSGLWETSAWQEHPHIIQLGTFSKALGGFGGYIACTQVLKDTLINTCRSFIYSTSLPPSVIASNQAALKLVMQDPQYTNTLWDNITYFKRLLQTSHPNLAIESPIIPIVIGADDAALHWENQLLAQGLFVKAIRPPTVPDGTARLRVTICGFHDKGHLEQLAATLEKTQDVHLS